MISEKHFKGRVRHRKREEKERMIVKEGKYNYA
jgi:hypothetical protein